MLPSHLKVTLEPDQPPLGTPEDGGHVLFGCKDTWAREIHGAIVNVGDQSRVIDRALVCFNDNFIFSSCAANNRLTQTGLINVPPEQTDDYCNGPCLAETKLVLNCIDNMLSNFLFYNKATVRDIRSSLRTGCGFSNERVIN
ncbi:hypothetical protein C5167_030716 [Papaver somniferum]|nr:hypothetical protein C5167_030716 [Papaver somniferum]